MQNIFILRLVYRTLKAYANSDNVEMAEYTINERVEDILRSIFLKKNGRGFVFVLYLEC